MADLIFVNLGPMSHIPNKPYAGKAIARMKRAAEAVIKTTAKNEFAIAPADKPAYSVSITLYEILFSAKTKILTCNLKGVVSDPKGNAFGLNLTANPTVGVTIDEEGDVLACIDDAVPKMLLIRALPAIKDNQTPPAHKAPPPVHSAGKSAATTRPGKRH